MTDGQMRLGQEEPARPSVLDQERCPQCGGPLAAANLTKVCVRCGWKNRQPSGDARRRRRPRRREFVH